VDIAHKMLEAGATVIVGAHPHVLQPMETYKTQDGRDTLIFYSLGNFLSNQSRGYVDGLNPDSNGDPRDEMIGLFAAVKRDYGPAGVRVELGHVGMLPVWEENNRNEMVAGREKKTVIKPVLIDREIPPAQTRLDELNKAAQGSAGLADDQKNEFIEVTKRLKLLTDRRAKILARVGDDYVMAPPKLQSKP
jgi:poly-gamma-glutamate synthesis protein (capsule biosynthesis protein)